MGPSNAVLRRMRRRWCSRRYIDRCRLVKQRLDLPALTTDIIVGFPGETEADFAATCRAAEEVGFSKIHVFPFSPRRGTPAAQMDRMVAAPVKAERVARLTELEGCLRERYFQALVGRRLQVLVESPAGRPGWMLGTSCRYAPVELPAAEKAARTFQDVIAGPAAGGRIVGERIVAGEASCGRPMLSSSRSAAVEC